MDFVDGINGMLGYCIYCIFIIFANGNVWFENTCKNRCKVIQIFVQSHTHHREFCC